MSEKILGKPERLAEEALKGVEKELRARLEEVKEGALKIIDTAFEEAMKEAEQRITRILSDAEEKLKAEQAALEAELRLRLARIRGEWIDRVLREVEQRISGFLDTKEYEEALERLVVQAVAQIEGDEVIVEANERDVARVKEIIERLRDPEAVRRLAGEKGLEVSVEAVASKNIRLDEKPAPILGGIRARTPDSRMVVDYSLDLILAQIARDMRATIARMLFGGEQ